MPRQQEKRDRELRSLDRISRVPRSAPASGFPSLMEGDPAAFAGLVRQYGVVMEMALERRAFKVEHKIPEELHSLADLLGSLKAGPRDVVEIYKAALSEKTQGVPLQRAYAYLDEGRLLMLELMGYLASHYRDLCLRNRGRADAAGAS
ncbi:MAG: hypothetical protein WD696_03765 [Bryobacteraceae bacterium]